MNTAFAIKKMGLQSYRIIEKSTTRLGGKILKFVSPGGNDVFLKIGQGAEAASLRREKNALEWLKEKNINIPKVINYFDDGNDVYLLSSALEGSAAYVTADLNKQEILCIIAKALRQFHSINMTGSEKLRTLSNDLAHVQMCLKMNLIKVSNFRKANNGKTPEEVYFYLRQMQDRFSRDAIIHGDCCLPNILIDKNSYGFLDVGDCGPGDRYKDFSAMEVSIARNFGSKWIEVFYRYYGGMKVVDRFKIKYYQLIDQFGYHLDIDRYRKLYSYTSPLRPEK